MNEKRIKVKGRRKRASDRRRKGRTRKDEGQKENSAITDIDTVVGRFAKAFDLLL